MSANTLAVPLTQPRNGPGASSLPPPSVRLSGRSGETHAVGGRPPPLRPNSTQPRGAAHASSARTLEQGAELDWLQRLSEAKARIEAEERAWQRQLARARATQTGEHSVFPSQPTQTGEHPIARRVPAAQPSAPAALDEEESEWRALRVRVAARSEPAPAAQDDDEWRRLRARAEHGNGQIARPAGVVRASAEPRQSRADEQSEWQALIARTRHAAPPSPNRARPPAATKRRVVYWP